MSTLFFSAGGRVARGRFWLGQVALLGAGFTAITVAVLASVAPHVTGGGKNVPLLALLGLVSALLTLATLVLTTWAAVCLGIKRFHDLDKPGVWVLIQFVPLVGPLWYLIEAGFIEGTRGPNLYGADPLRPELGAALAPAQPAGGARATGGRPGWAIPLLTLMALPGVLLVAAGLIVGARDLAWLKSAVHVEGTVAALLPESATGGGGRSASYRPVYEAQTPEGAPLKVESIWARKPAPAIGSSVDLVYEPGKPDTAAANDLFLWVLPGFLTGWGVMWAGFWLFAIGLVSLLWRRAPRAVT